VAVIVSTSTASLCEARRMQTGVSPRIFAVLLVIAASTIAPGCARAHMVPILGGGPGRPGDPEILRDAVRALQVLGYQPQALDATHGTFHVIARSDRSGLTRFVVQCFSDGYVSIVPEGGSVRRVGEETQLLPRVHDEYLRLAASIGSGIEVRR
jgi:hypothetical protein